MEEGRVRDCVNWELVMEMGSVVVSGTTFTCAVASAIYFASGSKLLLPVMTAVATR